MFTLGIETSCDETALALIESRENGGSFEYRVIASLIHSQAQIHSQYGGVYPSVAKREHGRNLMPLLAKLGGMFHIPEKSGGISEKLIDEKIRDLETQNPDLAFSLRDNKEILMNKPNIDRIAVTEGPGLEPALWVGINFAKVLGNIWQIPVIPVNHMEGHVLGSLIEDNKSAEWKKLKALDFPAIALLISGGHTEIQEVKSDGKSGYVYNVLGQTKDDAIGEAFDKVARLLGLPYPGGPAISKLADQAIAENIICSVKLPRPMINSGDLNFSFSGIKTAVLYAVRDHEKIHGPIDEVFKKGLAREFQEAVIETISKKVKMAMEMTSAKTLIVGGGVSANSALRLALNSIACQFGAKIYLPSMHISGDNALMIALVGALAKDIEIRDLRAEGTKRLENKKPR